MSLTSQLLHNKIHKLSVKTVKITFFCRKQFKIKLISAEILKFCRNSTKSRKCAEYFEKSLNSTQILNLFWKLRFWAKSQRKWDNFGVKSSKIVCHDPQIRSIIPIFKIQLWFQPNMSQFWTSESQSWFQTLQSVSWSDLSDSDTQIVLISLPSGVITIINGL